ncbi:MAG: glycerophosphodiester phosphodiesterase family protein [Candidatus Hydrogenedentes bacterium]|nr:glycerophosphodiester phosphodiesterase family protein [Candidatus Hydrogenedentota bacterium]
MRAIPVFTLSCLCIVLACSAGPLPPLSNSDAIALVEFKSGALAGARVETSQSQYTVTGNAPDGAISAQIDPVAARVLSISQAGKETYTFPGVIAVGHRGTVKFAPENTIAAFNKAIEIGVDLLEMDVRETKDGKLVIMHDISIARTTTGRGNVAEMTLDEIRSFDAGSKFGAKFSGEKAPTFAEALEAIKGRALPDIDFKAGDPRKVIDAVRAAGLVGKCTLYCGDWARLHDTLELEKGFVIRPTSPKGIDGLEKVIQEFDPPIINIDWANFSEEFIRAIHLKGKLAFVNTMGKTDGRESIVRAIDAGADYIQSDEIDVLIHVLREKGLHK